MNVSSELKKSKRALFLDRDGVLNVDKSYVHKVEDLELIEGVCQFLSDRAFNSFYKFIVTNQSGVARGLFDEDAVHIFIDELISKLSLHGVIIDDVEISPYHFDKGVNDYKLHSLTRKPYPGMFLKLMFRHPIDLRSSFMIGDNLSDDIKFIQLQTIHLKGVYDLSSANAPVASSFSEIKDIIFNS